MGLVATWLTGCGLSHAIPNFTAAGIVTPAALAELDLAHYEALGISSPEDRRKIFYLVQRVKLAVEKERKESANSQPASLEEQMDALIESTTLSPTATGTANPNKENFSSLGENVTEKHEVARKPTSMSKRTQSPKRASPVKKKSTPSKIPAPSPKRGSPSSKPSPSNTRSASSPTEKTTHSPETSDRNDASELDESNWGDGEESECADDEASIPIQSTFRRSKRLAEKGAPGTSNVARATAASTQKNGVASGFKTPQPKAKATGSLTKPSSTRRTESKLQNPSKSMRTGKQLSTIPADSILPMSPLTTMPPPQLDEKSDHAKDGISGRNGKSKSRRSTSGSVSDTSDSESSVGGRTRSRNRRSSLQGKHLGRRTNGNTSDSDSSASRNRRKTIGRIQAPKTTTKNNVTKERASVGTSQSTTKKGTKFGGAKPKKVIHGRGESVSWKKQIDALRQEIALEHELFSEEVFHDDDDGDDMIRVIVRKRPFHQDKPSDIDVIHPLEYGCYGKMLVYQPITRVDLTKEISKIPFAYDGVFGEEYNNLQIYNKAVRSLIPVVLEGQHSTVFAFGCTGSGKTHTMMGSNFTGKRIVEEENMGLYYMAAMDVFRSLEEFEYSHLSVGVSLFEIYGGKLFDLLNDRKMVKCLEDHKGCVQFPGLSEHRIEDPGELIELIELGAQSRSTGTTSRNSDSSRSHAVLQLHLRKSVGRKQNVEHGRLTFIDLAGSERGADTANYSRATRLEGAEINTSLLALKEVIRARARGGSMTHVPFRGSKLTQVLKESFVGENSRCLMIACIAPDMESCEQTLNTLRYADRVKERNAGTGALPSRFKRGGRRRTNAMRSTASLSSIVSMSDQSVSRTQKTKKETPKQEEEEESASDHKSSNKESGPEITRSNTNRRNFTNECPPTIAASVSEDDTDALLAAVLSEDPTYLVPDNEASQTNGLVEELVETHESFLTTVLKMVNDEIEVVIALKADLQNVSTYSLQLDSQLQNQSSLISDLRECFETYESIKATELGSQLQKHRTVLTKLLEIVRDEQLLASVLNDSIGVIDQIESLQDEKISQISELQEVSRVKMSWETQLYSHDTASDESSPQSFLNGSSIILQCFSAKSKAIPAAESKEPELLLAESFQADSDEISIGSFEDLRDGDASSSGGGVSC
ncbi:Kinesin-like protein KIF2A [Seminavis robusta]|uniref:Kinesin-like protein KIF2A n=1 Tax=Seminavis robusta TaxID=568900 RepID=A0A9N8DKP0_9STRA|nr:Kinesin-like protein KIF2A [Seminavis robusta]|eukprot:Sro135_g063800.1 Kinesin-like protein KIF2A (1160) ;mRNA; f:56357-60499